MSYCPLKPPLDTAKFQALFRTSLVFHFLPWSRAYRFVSSAKACNYTQELMQGGRRRAYVMSEQDLCEAIKALLLS